MCLSRIWTAPPDMLRRTEINRVDQGPSVGGQYRTDGSFLSKNRKKSGIITMLDLDERKTKDEQERCT